MKTIRKDTNKKGQHVVMIEEFIDMLIYLYEETKQEDLLENFTFVFIDTNEINNTKDFLDDVFARIDTRKLSAKTKRILKEILSEAAFDIQLKREIERNIELQTALSNLAKKYLVH